MKKIEKVKLILKDFKPFEPETKDYVEYYNQFIDISTRNYNPPSYIVQILLLGMLGFRDHGRMDKVLWHTYVQYKSCPFIIGDYKFGSWFIAGLKKDRETIQLAKEMQNKIIKASKIVNKVLYIELKSEMEKGRFYLHNVYHKLFSFYEFYEDKVLETVRKYDMFKNKIRKAKKNTQLNERFNDIAEKLNKELALREIISKYSFALMLAWFFLMEFLLDVIYIFEKTNPNFSEFRKKEWQERFKLAFPSFSKTRNLKVYMIPL